MKTTTNGRKNGSVQPEFKLQKILVPVDFSEPSRKALYYALGFAGQYGAEILLLHVVEPVPVMAEPVGLAAYDTGPQEKAVAQKLAGWRQELGPKTRVRTNVCVGSPYKEIIRIAGEENIDLIILGRHGRSGLAHLLLGSTAEHVLRRAPCPALVVREREHEFLVESTSRRVSKPAGKHLSRNRNLNRLEHYENADQP